MTCNRVLNWDHVTAENCLMMENMKKEHKNLPDIRRKSIVFLGVKDHHCHPTSNKLKITFSKNKF